MTQSQNSPQDAQAITPRQTQLLEAVEAYAEDKDELIKRILAFQSFLGHALKLAQATPEGELMLMELGHHAQSLSMMHQVLYRAYSA